MITATNQVKNGKVQKVYTFNFPKDWTNEAKQMYLLNRDFDERSAYMIAFNISESEMKRIENS